MVEHAGQGSNVVVIGAGFAGLAAAYELAKAGIPVTVLEQDDCVGGLGASFEVNGMKLEKFYHHWFMSDMDVFELVRELGLEEQLLFRKSQTGMYYNKKFFKLNSPMDVLRFTPLSLLNRVRLGLLTLKVRGVKDWMSLESLTAEEWVKKLAGSEAYRVVWEPLLRGKFGSHSSDTSAVWLWNKIKLRGGSRNKWGGEELTYLRGGFSTLCDRLVEAISAYGGSIEVNSRVDSLAVAAGRVTGVSVGKRNIGADYALMTPAQPLIADLVEAHAPAEYTEKLRSVEYLANMCLVLELNQSLSSIYWLNVNDVDFPYVGVIEHTNFIPPENYGGRHIVYLSKYLSCSDTLYSMSKEEVLDFTIPHIKKMFPSFQRNWIRGYHLWKASYAQPIVTKHYSEKVVPMETPIEGLFVCSMAQIYPEDRGTNYAIRHGKVAARKLVQQIKGSH